MNINPKGFIAVSIGLAILVLGCLASNIIPVTWNAIVGELNHPKPAPSIEQQTVAGAVVDTNGDTAATLTGYEMTFPKGTVDWRVTYAGKPSTDYMADSRYTIIEPTYWCKMEDGKWLSCQPVISERAS